MSLSGTDVGEKDSSLAKIHWQWCGFNVHLHLAQAALTPDLTAAWGMWRVIQYTDTARTDFFFFLRFKVRCFNISQSHRRKPFIMGGKWLENGLLINVKWESAPQSKGGLAAVQVMSLYHHFLGRVIRWGPIPGYICLAESIQHKSCRGARLETANWEPSTARWVTTSQKLLKPLILIFLNH